jgi:hypothetical protein
MASVIRKLLGFNDELTHQNVEQRTALLLHRESVARQAREIVTLRRQQQMLRGQVAAARRSATQHEETPL